ncbi:hypothetical protein [Novosphingobium huizhouense]|uniref:hypothetical protein n=1 Tax=Novosphingobium huizhouense TaxID=2866625 RepID=UPI001CD8EE1E|nr:hypothetical protein [Novosphingobium huizhouense]
MFKQTVRTCLAAVLATALVLPGVAVAGETRSGASLPAAPVASKLHRSLAPLKGQRSAQAGSFPYLIVVTVVAVGLGLFFAVSDGGDEEPTSAG